MPFQRTTADKEIRCEMVQHFANVHKGIKTKPKTKKNNEDVIANV